MPDLNVPHHQPLAALWYKAITGILVAIIAIALAFVVLSSTVVASADSVGIASFALPTAVFFSLIVLAYPVLYYFLFTYEITQQAITINSGILFRQHETINFNRIQVIDNERGPLLMIFGLTRVEIWTASPDQVSVSGHGTRQPAPDATIYLKKRSALEIKDFIAQRPGPGAL